MGFFDSKSSNTNLTQTDNTSIGVQGGIGIKGGEGDIHITDGGAVAQAMEAVRQAIANFTAGGVQQSGQAYTFAGDTVDQAFGFGGDSLALVGDTFSAALGFVEDAVNDIAALGETTLEGNQRISEQSLALAESVKTGMSTQMTRLIFMTVGVVGVVLLIRKGGEQ